MFGSVFRSEKLHGRIVVVTGAGGFIGPAVVKELLGSGATVRALVGPPCAPGRTLAAKRLINVASEITDAGAIRNLLEGADTVVHMAGPASVGRSFEQSDEYLRTHVVGTATVLNACRSSKIQKVVYVSSAEVYGQPDTDIVCESHPVRPRSPYAAAKASAEHFVNVNAMTSGIPTVILRPFSIYGPGASILGVVGKIFEMAKSGDEIVLNDLKVVRDFCFVDDFARAVSSACMLDLCGIDTVNIGSGVGIAVGEFAATVVRVLQRQIPICQNNADMRPSSANIRSLIADRSHARNILRWEPCVSLIEGIRRCL